jgi:hypothetical protein
MNAKQIIKLLEEWSKSIPGINKKEKVNIYENPGSTDVKELYPTTKKEKLVRYIADAKEKKVYVWSALLAMHTTVRKEIGLGDSGPDSRIKYPSVIEGFGLLSGGRIVSVSMSNEGDMWLLESNMKKLLEWEKTTSLSKITVKEVLKSRDFIISLLTNMSNHDWSFLDRYVVGDGAKLKKLQLTFKDFMKRINIYK